MKVAITGANGLVGVNLALQLINQGHQVKGLYYHSKNGIESLNMLTVKGDINDYKAMESFVKDTDVIFHCAAAITISNTPYKELYRTNVEGTKNVFNAALKAGAKTFVYFSSIHALEQKKGVGCDEHCPLALHSGFLYEKTKALAQQWLQQQKDKGIKIVIINPTAIIGPNDYRPSLIGEFILNTARKKIPVLIKGGYNWVDVRDVVNTAINAVTRGKNGDHYLVGGQWESLINMTKMIEKTIHEKIPVRVVPLWLAWAGLPFLRFWSFIHGKTPLYTSDSLKILNSSNKKINYQKAITELGHQPRPLENTLKDTINWFKQNNYL